MNAVAPLSARRNGSANSWRGRHRVPERGNPLVVQLFEIINHEGCTMQELTARSGVARSTIGNWRLGKDPRLANFEAAIGALGYRLVMVRSDG